MRKASLRSAVAVMVILAFGPSSYGEERPAKYQVTINNFSFGPANLTIPAGATVTWINKDDEPHIVVSKDGKDFKSPVLDTDEKFTHEFAQPGTYDYYCSIHPMMTGKIIVQ